MCILSKISNHDDLLRLTRKERLELCQEIRQFLINSVSQTGGHLASNLGTVELSVAIETVFDTMKDRLVFDVGHQSYVHKLLTGRQADFEHLRQYGGMSGFPKPSESQADSFVAGHASSSVSIALGMARARTLMGKDYNVVALIGDGAATGGMAYEGLNDAAESGEPMVVILNDNEMSIDPNVGGVARHLSKLRSGERYLRAKKRYQNVLFKVPGGKRIYNFSSRVKNRIKRVVLPSTIFENMGLTYYGPIDGHDLDELIRLLSCARDLREPVVVHVMTHKGKGYVPAEENPSAFHGIGRFDPATGQTIGTKASSFSGGFGKVMAELAAENNRICAITAAMPSGTGLLNFQNEYPNRTFDVGIAEEHAVSMAGGLAKQGMIPVVALYSTFLQRAFDQVIQDTAMLHLHVVFAIDRAGLVGEDGETHHGIYDIGFMRQAPGMRVLCPASIAEQQDMLRWAIQEYDGPVAVRYPRGGNRGYEESDWNGIDDMVKCHRSGKDVTLITYGVLLENVLEAADILASQGIEATVLRMLSVAPLPTAQIVKMMSQNHHVMIFEETSGNSGIREALGWELEHMVPDCRIDGADLGCRFITHGSLKELYKHYKLDGASMAAFTQEALAREG